MTTDDRRGAADARRGMTDRGFDLADEIYVFGLFGRGGGLQSQRLHVRTICSGDGDDAGFGPWARHLTDSD